MSISDINIRAADLIEIVFTSPMKVNAAFKDPASYTITPVGSGVPVTVKDVWSGNATQTTSVFLVVTVPTEGGLYDVATPGSLVDITGAAANVDTARFRMRRTKTDDLLSKSPRMYDLRPKSIYRSLFQAIGREDDLIGGALMENPTITAGEVPAPAVPDTGEWMYLDHVLVGAEGPVNKMEITGLTGNTQEEYLVVFNIKKQNVGTAYDLQLRINGALTSREARGLTSVTLKSPETNLLVWLGTTATDTVGEVEVSARSNPRGSSRDFPKLYRGMGTRGSGSGMNVFAVSGAWNNTADEVISLAIVSTDVDLDTLVNDIAEGSVMEVWRRSLI